MTKTKHITKRNLTNIDDEEEERKVSEAENREERKRDKQTDVFNKMYLLTLL
jgi:hypothetical protein